MKETIRIQNIILAFKNKFLSSSTYLVVYPTCNSIKNDIQNIDTKLQKLEDRDTEEYYNLMNKKEELLESQKNFKEEIKEYIEKLKLEIIQTLTDELQNIETQISAKSTLEDSFTVEELEDLRNAKGLCEIHLNKLREEHNFSENSQNSFQQKEPEEFENPVNSTIDEIDETEKVQEKEIINYEIIDDMEQPDYKIIDDMKQPYKSKKYTYIDVNDIPQNSKKLENSDYDITDDMNGTITRIHSTPQNSRKSENLDFEIIDDMEQARKSEEDTQEKENIDKDINIYISEKKDFVQYTDKEGKKFQLSISSIKAEKPDTYKRISIDGMCKKVAGNGLQGAYLSHKISPILIKILDGTGNNQMIYDYIKSIYNHEPLPFNLYHDLSGLTEIEKWKLLRFTKPEEKSGAEIIKDSEVKLLFEQKSEETKKRNTDFIPKADGNQEEIARKYNEQKRPIEDLLNALDASPSCKMTIADYINKFGEEKARIRYKKQFGKAEATLSIRDFLNSQRNDSRGI